MWVLYKGLGCPQILVSLGILEPIPLRVLRHGYSQQSMPFSMFIYKYFIHREKFFFGGGLLCFTYTCIPNEYFIKFSALLKVLEVNWH